MEKYIFVIFKIAGISIYIDRDLNIPEDRKLFVPYKVFESLPLN